MPSFVQLGDDQTRIPSRHHLLAMSLMNFRYSLPSICRRPCAACARSVYHSLLMGHYENAIL